MTRLQNPTGEGSCHFRNEHSLFISLAPRPIEYVQSQDGKTYRGLYRAGDLLITPANTPLFVRWKGEEDCLLLQVSDRLLRDVARETLSQDSDRSIIEIALDCGFSSHSHLSKQFRQVTGMTPKAYRDS